MLKDVRNILDIAGDEFWFPRYDFPEMEMVGFLGGRLLDKVFGTDYKFSYKLPGEVKLADIPPHEQTQAEIEDIAVAIAAGHADPLPDGESPDLYG